MTQTDWQRQRTPSEAVESGFPAINDRHQRICIAPEHIAKGDLYKVRGEYRCVATRILLSSGEVAVYFMSPDYGPQCRVVLDPVRIPLIMVERPI